MALPHPPKDFVLEGGKYHLAEALFNAFKFKIRCPHCVGNPREAGFIKDQGGKGGPDGQRRRLWTCQRSNSRRATIGRCSRASCTEYIDLAIQQLQPTQFTELLDGVCQRFPPERDEYAALQGYANLDPGVSTSPSTPVSSLLSQTLSRKRKAEEELLGPEKTTRHAQIQERRESSGPDSSTLQSTLQHLESLLEMSKTWQEQHKMLTIFLTSSSPPQPTPSSQTPSWSSPSLAPERVFSSDATVPCTYPEDELSSSPLSPSSDATKSVKGEPSSSIPERPSKCAGPVRAYVGAAVLERSHDSTPATHLQSSSPPPATDIDASPVIPPVKLSSDPMDRVRALVQRFQQAGSHPATATQQRRTIRQQARAEGLHTSFQSLLKQDVSTLNPKLKCFERR